MIDTLCYDYGRYGTDPGWVCRYSFHPDNMTSMNNEMFTFKDGDIYVHHSENVPRTNYYGVQYTHSVSFIFNEGQNEDKLFKTLNLMSNFSYKATIQSDMSSGLIDRSSFVLKETDWFSYIRRVDSNTLSNNDIKNLSTQGIGNIVSWDSLTNTATYSIPIDTNVLTIGGGLYIITGSSQIVFVGIISSFTSATITVSSTMATVTGGDYSFVSKNKVAESNGVRGYFMEVTLENDEVDSSQLFSVSTEIFKSYP